MRGAWTILASGLILAGPAAAQPIPTQPAPAQPAPVPPVQALDGYAEAAATTIIAEQSCPGVRLNAGALTTLRLAARVGPSQEGVLEEKLRTRASQLRQQLTADGRVTWCEAALAAFGLGGTVARGVLAQGLPGR